jgi:hypothetical protein
MPERWDLARRAGHSLAFGSPGEPLLVLGFSAPLARTEPQNDERPVNPGRSEVPPRGFEPRAGLK